MRSKIRAIALVVVLPMILVSCSYISKSSLAKNRSKGYLYARSIPPLQIPPGVSSKDFHTQYPVSDRHYPRVAEDMSIVPPGLNK
jgi:uncharacterized lipoprotein